MIIIVKHKSQSISRIPLRNIWILISSMADRLRQYFSQDRCLLRRGWRRRCLDLCLRVSRAGFNSRIIKVGEVGDIRGIRGRGMKGTGIKMGIIGEDRGMMGIETEVGITREGKGMMGIEEIKDSSMIGVTEMGIREGMAIREGMEIRESMAIREITMGIRIIRGEMMVVGGIRGRIIGLITDDESETCLC
jgi:hypothetical protein